MMDEKRIAVVGCTGSGKTTMACRLATKLKLDHVELDRLYWGPNWTACETEIFRRRVADALQCPTWVTDGNYGKVQDLILKDVQAIVWLDYPFLLIFFRLLKRTLWRCLTGQVVHSNKENLYTHLFTRDSLFLWLFQTYGSRRRQYDELSRSPEHGHIAVFRFHHPQEAERWLNDLT